VSLPILNPTLANAIFWGAVVSCVAAQVAILHALSRNREAGARASQLPPPRRLLEAVWAVLPALALAAVLIATWRKTHPTAITPMRSQLSAPQGAL
jgi:heme/copper-type cytochrome/quinol oxidase subunit 2